MQLPKYPFKHDGLVLVDGNKAVLRTDLGHLCGYVALTAEETPKEWHGNYDADALQYLAIHGGITYCDVGGGDEEARSAAEKAAHDAAEIDPDASLDDRMNAYAARRKAVDAAALTVPYTHVVFGFDCAHAGDEGSPELKDPEYVMGLTVQMERQLKAYAARLQEWRAADRDGRVAIMQQIIEAAQHKCELGFGAMIGALCGAPEFGEKSESA